MKKLWRLIIKDFQCEFRSKETIGLLVMLSILLSVLVSFGVAGSFVNKDIIEKLFPTFIWAIFVFASTVSITRSLEYEIEGSAISGLILTGVSPSLVYLSKVITNVVINLIGLLVATAVLGIMLNVQFYNWLLQFLFISSGVSLGYCAMSTLLTAMTATSRLKGLLLPVVLLPLLFPLLFAALELTTLLIYEGTIFGDTIWLSMLLAFDLIYIVAGINLFGVVISDI